MSSLSDILSATKNVVTALNQLGQTYLAVVGSEVRTEIIEPTVIKTGQGRVARVAVAVAGSALGGIFDASRTNDTTNRLAAIPTAVGIYEINLPVNNGIVVAPGTGQVVTISYS